MAESAVTAVIEDVLVDLVQHALGDLLLRLRAAADWVRENGEPPPGLRVVTTDGAAFTGLAILDRNKVVLLLAFEHDKSPQSNPEPPRYDPPRYQPRRDLFQEEPGDGWPPDPFLPRR